MAAGGGRDVGGCCWGLGGGGLSCSLGNGNDDRPVLGGAAVVVKLEAVASAGVARFGAWHSD